jgi:hypothetical protein
MLNGMEKRLPRRRHRRLVIRMPWETRTLTELKRRVSAAGVTVIDESFQRSQDLREVDVTLSIGFTDPIRFEKLETELQQGTELKLMASERV